MTWGKASFYRGIGLHKDDIIKILDKYSKSGKKQIYKMVLQLHEYDSYNFSEKSTEILEKILEIESDNIYEDTDNRVSIEWYGHCCMKSEYFIIGYRLINYEFSHDEVELVEFDNLPIDTQLDNIIKKIREILKIKSKMVNYIDPGDCAYCS